MSKGIVVPAEDLRRAARFAADAVERRSTIPVLECLVLRHLGGGRISVSGTNLDTVMEARIEGRANGAFAVALRADLILNLTAHAAGDITIERDGDILAMSSDDGCVARVRNLIPVSDWPDHISPRFGGDGVTSVISEGLLRKVISATAPCISGEATRYYLNGTFLHGVDGNLCAVATDGHRLARYQSEEPWPHQSAIVPRPVIFDLLRHLRPGGNREVRIRSVPFGDDGKRAGAMQFQTEDWTMSAKMIDGTFPDYARVIPPGSSMGAITATMTYEAVRRLYLARGDYPAVEISPDAGTIQVKDVGAGFSISVPCSGRGGSFGLNLHYLKAFCKRSQAATVSLS